MDRATDILSRPKSDYADDMLKDVQCVTLFSRLFFSQKNIDDLQTNIRYSVYSQTQQNIDNQDQLSLMLIMRDTYINYARVPECNVLTKKGKELYTRELKKLNQLTLESALDKVLTNLTQYNYYLADASKGLPILPTPVNASTAGTLSTRDLSEALFTNTQFFNAS